jgi:hypothetical protein
MVKVDEPDDDTACLMLRGLKSRYAEHHGVHITDGGEVLPSPSPTLPDRTSAAGQSG